MPHAFKLAALGLLTLTISACVYNPPRYQASATYTVGAGGYYEPWGYYYYPDAQVYFHVSTGDYFYLSGRTWIRTRVLPAYIHLYSRDRVKLRIENERPYLFHHQHVQQYRPRSNYRPTPQQDRREREENRRWYQEQQHYKSQRRYAPPAVQTRPRQVPRERYIPAPRYELRQPVPSQQPRIQSFEAPLLQPSRPRQVSPQDRNRTRNTEQEQQRRIDRQRQSPPSQGGTDSLRLHTVPVAPGNSNRQKSAPSTKQSKQKSRQSKQAEQYDEQGVQQGDDQRRVKKSRREQEEEQQRYQRR